MEERNVSLGTLGEKIAAGESGLDPKSIIDKVEAVTQDDLMRIASGIYRDDNLNLAVIGPVKDEKSLREALHI